MNKRVVDSARPKCLIKSSRKTMKISTDRGREEKDMEGGKKYRTEDTTKGKKGRNRSERK